MNGLFVIIIHCIKIKLLISDGKFTALVFISFLIFASSFSNKKHYNLSFHKTRFDLDGLVLETGALNLAKTFEFFCHFVTKILCFSSNLSQLGHFSVISYIKTSYELDRLYCFKLTGEVSNLFASVLHGTLWLIRFSDDTIQPPHKKYFCKSYIKFDTVTLPISRISGTIHDHLVN